MNKEQLQFFYDEIMGMFGWDDGDEASGVDPLLWAKKQIRDKDAKLAQLRAELDAKTKAVYEARTAISKAHDHLAYASFDYSNGNVDSTGRIDEGNVYGWQAHDAVLTELAVWLTSHPANGQGPEGKEE